MHARPCIYCIMLLSSLFASSCYWQPISTSYLVSRHPGLAPPPNANITLPTLTAFPERCWCDLYDSVFSAFNVTRWEQRALYRAVRPAVDEWKKTQGNVKTKEASTQWPSTDRASNDEATPVLPVCDAEQERHWLLRGHGPFTRFLVDRIAGQTGCRPPASDSDTAPSPVSPEGKKRDDNGSGPASPISSPPPATKPGADGNPVPIPYQAPLPWLRRKYDLTPYGIGIILDFGVGPDDS
ncbi:hypothetical protein AURDEDRAFT_178837 [Auricularia subglabra TFB-10046 SS5]|nr:hypothetical protein AURDEDRAFT_178837 [Auricularia subglabra TFB-10046 SS5]